MHDGRVDGRHAALDAPLVVTADEVDLALHASRGEGATLPFLAQIGIARARFCLWNSWA